MAKNTVPRGETSVIRHVFIMDSASTTGAGKTGLLFNTASLTAYYLYPAGTAGALTLETIATLGTYAAPTSNAHLRFKEVDATNMPGWYELQFHNDWFSVANARRAACLQLKGATGMAPLNLEIDCIGAAIQDALLPVNATQISGGGTAADNCELMFDGTGYAGGTAKLTVDLSKILGTTLTETSGGYLAAAFKKLFNVATPLLMADAAMRGTDGAYTGTPPTTAAIATALWTDLLASADFSTASSIGKLLKDYVDAAISSRGTSTYNGGAVASVTAPVTAGTVNDKTGYALASTGLDAITATEPSAKPTTFPGWLMWLVQRFRRASKTPTALLTKTEAGAVITTQVLTDDGSGTETLGAPS